MMHAPIYLLAIDHRWQWEAWCDANGVSRERIFDIKRLALDAFLDARTRSVDVQASGALLVDLTYGAEAFAAARSAGITVGTPAEKAGAFPLEWAGAFDRALPGDFVKVLVRHGSDTAAGVVAQQRQQLLEVQAWCAAAGKPLVLEVLVAPGQGDDTASFDAVVRPQLISSYIRDAYAAALVPHFWKVEGMPDRRAFATVDAAVREVAGAGQLILGKGAGMGLVRQWFASASGMPTAAGFAIGRTVYQAPAAEWIIGRCTRAEAVNRIADNYLSLIGAWRGSAGAAAPR